jgi:hypothetical protein
MPATPARPAPPWSPWRPRPDAAPRAVAARSRPAVVAAVKTVHTLAWLSIESCVLYVLIAGFAGRTGKRVGIAGAIVAGETLVFAANGFRCPLTELAERYGAQHPWREDGNRAAGQSSASCVLPGFAACRARR